MKAWEIASEVLLKIKQYAIVGMPLTELDNLAEHIILSHNAIPYNKGYKNDLGADTKAKEPFPSTLVCCVNSVIAHGHATEYKIRDGDTIVFDVGVKKDGLCGDCAFTLEFGNVENKNRRLVRYAKQTLQEAIKHIKAGVSVAEIGRVIEHYAALRGYIANQGFGGHGIGEEMHEDPYIPNYWMKEFENIYFEEGKMYCIEPILTFKDKWGIKAEGNDWAWVTSDGRRSAMFEHQILVTKTGCEILTTHI